MPACLNEEAHKMEDWGTFGQLKLDTDDSQIAALTDTLKRGKDSLTDT